MKVCCREKTFSPPTKILEILLQLAELSTLTTYQKPMENHGSLHMVITLVFEYATPHEKINFTHSNWSCGF